MAATTGGSRSAIEPTSNDDRAAALAVLAAGIVFAFLAIARLWTFEANAIDTSHLNNVLWKVAWGYGDVTGISGLHHFADHVSPLLLFSIPIYWIAPGFALSMLIGAQAASVALVAWAGWIVSGHAGLERRTRWAVLGLTLLGPGAYYSAMVELHSTGLALGPLAMTVAAAIRCRPLRTYWIWPLMASLARIEIAAGVVIAGLLLHSIDRRDHARVATVAGGAVTLGMLGWMIFTPWGGTSVSAHFWHLDGVEGLADLPRAAITQPGVFLGELTNPVMLWAVVLWLLSFLLIAPLRAAKWLLIAAPILAIPVLGGWPAADLWFEHYWHGLYPALAIATPMGLAGNAGLQRFAVAGTFPVLAFAWIVGGPHHYLVPDSFGLPPLSADRSLDLAVVRLINGAPDAAVSTSWSAAAHIGNREMIHLFPTPFTCPAVPLAVFLPPDSPPDLVIVDEREVRTVSDEDAPRIAWILETYYEQIFAEGPVTLWELTGDPPPDVFSVSCNPTQQLRAFDESL